MVRKGSVTGELLIPLVNISLEDIKQTEKRIKRLGVLKELLLLKNPSLLDSKFSMHTSLGFEETHGYLLGNTKW